MFIVFSFCAGWAFWSLGTPARFTNTHPYIISTAIYTTTSIFPPWQFGGWRQKDSIQRFYFRQAGAIVFVVVVFTYTHNQKNNDLSDYKNTNYRHSHAFSHICILCTYILKLKLCEERICGIIFNMQRVYRKVKHYEEYARRSSFDLHLKSYIIDYILAKFVIDLVITRRTLFMFMTNLEMLFYVLYLYKYICILKAYRNWVH